MVDIAQRLTSYTTRPPTPPKERTDPTLDTSSPNGYFATITHQILLDTPNESPSSSAEYFAGSSGKGTKKVEFSPWPLFHKPISSGGKTPGSEGNIRRLPPSRDCKSSKSILKETFKSSPLAELPMLGADSIPKLLPSAILHLRSASRSSRLDAYSALLGCMSAYDDNPDAEALLSTLPDFVEFIRRDLCATTNANNTLDTQLISQSLKLLIVFLCTSALVNALPDEFRLFILNKSISSLENATLPKILVTHHMQVLAKQTFSEKHMTDEKATRLLSALQGITDHQKGNSIVGLRLRIYHRLLNQARPSLIAQSEHWMDHLVSGMLSNTKDIRALAINFGIDAGTCLGSTSTVSQACFDLFARKSPEGQTVMDFLATRLHAMIASKEEGVHVPQIWSVIILLLRNRRHRLERWLHLKSWLLVLQKCFNSNEAHIKLLAMTAWNRLVSVVEPDASTKLQMVKMLRQPIITQLSRKGTDKSSKQSKQIAQSSYCNLLYYAFRPLATHAQLDLFWDHYVEQVMPESFSSTKRDINRACEILAALLHNEQAKTWNENRANGSGFVMPDELPCLDPKWVRSRADKIMIIFGKLVHAAAWPSEEPEKSPLILAWRSFTISLAEAGKQEVKVSVETMNGIAHALNMMRQFWAQAYLQKPNLPVAEATVAITKLQILIQEAIGHMGVIPLNERRLLQIASDRFEASETPSSRSVHHRGTLGSPIIHLLRLLTTSIASDAGATTIAPTMRSLLQVALSSTSSRRSQLGILRELTALISSGDAAQSNVRSILWSLIAEATVSALAKPKQDDSSSDSPQYAGPEFRDVAKILEVAIHGQFTKATWNWQVLFDTACQALRKEIGEGGIILMLIEPLSPPIQHQLSAAYTEWLLPCATSVIKNIPWSSSQHTLDRARKLLWGIPTITQKPTSTDSLDKVYSMIECSLLKTYQKYASTRKEYMVDLLHVTESVLTSAPASARRILLVHIQRGVASWIEDQQANLGACNVSTEQEKVYSTVQTLWTACKAAIETLPHVQSTLTQLEALISSSLCSRHRSILNDAIALWNATFGGAEQLEYSDNLRKILSRLSKVTEIQLPAFPCEDDTEALSSPFNFVETQASQELIEEGRARTPAKAATITPRLQGNITPSKAKGSPRRQVASSEPKSLRRTITNRVSKTPPKARLRHNDSQIHFAPIDSSPLAFDDTESQLLTDHQKEIRERQTYDAAIFPKIGSCPSSNGRKKEPALPRLILEVSTQPQGTLETDDQMSPVLPMIDENLEAFLGSSPTPRSSKQYSSDALPEGDPSSSPPGAPSLAAAFPEHTDLEMVPAVVEDTLQIQGNRTLETETLHQGRILEKQQIPKVVDDRNVVTSDQVEKARGTERWVQCGPTKGDGNTDGNSGMQMFSDFDVFVDAPAEPPQGGSPARIAEDHGPQTMFAVPTSEVSPAKLSLEDAPLAAKDAKLRDLSAEDGDSTSQVMDSFVSQSSQYSKDEEQIAAQLASDMEKASQQTERMSGSPQTTDKRKRKRRSSASSASTKRLRSSPRGQQCQVVVESRKPADVMEDECIILDTRSANNSPVRSSPEARLTRNTVRNVRDPASRTPARRTSARQDRRSDGHDQRTPKVGQEKLAPATPSKVEKEPIAGPPVESAPSPSPRKSAYRRLMDGFKSLLGEVRQVTLRAEEREVTGVLFDSILEVHEAGKRHLQP